MLPTVAESDGQGVAGWRPVLQGPDVATLHALVAALPPICRAEVDTPGDLRGQRPDELVAAALRALVDAAVREALAAAGISTTDGLPSRRSRRPRRVPAAQAWLQALGRADGLFDADPDDVVALTGALAPWRDFGVGQAGPARVTFRLVEPPTPGTIPLDHAPGGPREPEPGTAALGWRLEFLLQSVRDPSLLVPAD